MDSQGTQYENLKFKAEIYRTAAFGVASPLGAIAIQLALFGIVFSWILLWHLSMASFSLIGYTALINISQSIMNDREWRIKRERRTKDGNGNT